MKVLFAVSNEEISESIVKKYQKEYKQIISYKNVYYFNAILKELQKDKTYDRIVINEELEAFTNTQYEQIDKFIFEKLDSISDEASNSKGNDIPIILIASDRRDKSEEMLVKLFGIGVYNVIIGPDRSVDEVCKLINRPRSKKEAKTYYKIETENVKYQSESENDVSEMEIQNIRAHYNRLGRDEEKYVESFNNIAAQYNNVQLRIISKYLPFNVQAVLEEKSPKYQQIMSFNSRVSNALRTKTEKQAPSEKLLVSKSKVKINPGSVVIPSAINVGSATKLTRTKSIKTPAVEEIETIEEVDEVDEVEEVEPIEQIEEPEKKRRGRPRKNPVPEEAIETVKKRRGRPRKNPIPEETIETIETEEIYEEEEEESVVLPGFEEEENEEAFTLPGFDDDYEEDEEESKSTQKRDFFEEESSNSVQHYNVAKPETPMQQTYNIVEPQVSSQTYHTLEPKVENIDLSYLLTGDKKIVTFVGTSKNGTSFIVNNLAELLSTAGVNVAILDTTKNKNSYYIYTNNDEELRTVATHSIYDLANGVANGISVNEKLTVYTSLPSEGEDIINADKILETLLKKHTLILIDTDFDTPAGYFKQSKETYLVQSLDILTIQPLTAFLRELKEKDILDQRKLRIILNKTVKLKGVTDKTIIGGMAFYNDPSMSYMTELFDRTLIKYISIPFEEETYTKYLENIINCNVSLKGYSKMFMQAFRELANMVYPISVNYVPPTANTKSDFNPSINSTLDQMRSRY